MRRIQLALMRLECEPGKAVVFSKKVSSWRFSSVPPTAWKLRKGSILALRPADPAGYQVSDSDHQRGYLETSAGGFAVIDEDQHDPGSEN